MVTELVSPPPKRVSGRVPYVGAGLDFLRDPTELLKRARVEHGETFLLEAFGFKLLFVFSPAGVRSLYKLPERQASFVEATRTLIGFKLPEELLSSEAGMSMFHHLFGRSQVEGYLSHMVDAVRADLAELPVAGELEIFSHMKKIVHRMGFRCWAGREAVTPRYLARLVTLFEQLDPEEAFVHPAKTFLTVLTRKAPERRALAKVRAILDDIWERRTREGRREGDLFESLHELYAAEPTEVRSARVAQDVMILQLASLANLYAALSWTLVNLLLAPELLSRVRSGDFALIEQCAHESIRIAQRSITLRKVVAPCTLDDGERSFELAPGVFVATMLSVNNSAFPGLDRFDPDHYEKSRVAARVGLPTPEVVSTFGHGVHACPGQRFAVSAIRTAIAELVGGLELEPLFSSAAPKASQLGAVARSAEPCIVRFRKRRFS
ncbi:MAG: cytochrome P450 [Polyangiaceae bacterium]|nr:cytochrome P450 [Polyangiaceae bacterium]